MGYRIEYVPGAELPYQVKHDTYFTHCGTNPPYKDTFVVGACRAKEDADTLLAGLTRKQPQPTGPTVRVRALAVVVPGGQWEVCGWSNTDDGSIREHLKHYSAIADKTGAQWSVIEADLRVEPVVVQGRVVE